MKLGLHHIPIVQCSFQFFFSFQNTNSFSKFFLLVPKSPPAHLAEQRHSTTMDSDWERDTPSDGDSGSDYDSHEEKKTASKKAKTSKKTKPKGRKKATKPPAKVVSSSTSGEPKREPKKNRKQDNQQPASDDSNTPKKKRAKKEAAKPAPSVSDATAKRLVKKHFDGQVSVGLTGAREGDVLQGCHADTQNVLLKVDTGTIEAPFCVREAVEAHVGVDTIVQQMAKQFGWSRAVAALRYKDSPVSAPEMPNAQPLGKGCSHQDLNCDCEPAARFTLLNQGIWQQFAEEHGNGKAMQALVQEKKSICYRDVLRLVQTPGQPGGKTLILRPKLFRIVLGPVALAEDDPRLGKQDVIDGSAWIAKSGVATTVYEMDERLVRLPQSASRAPTVEDLPEMILKSIRGREDTDGITTKQVQDCIAILSPLTIGGLKSLLQKTIRFHAKSVDMNLNNEEGENKLPVALVAATAAGLLFTRAGNFSPELQLYTRGCTSALKRMGVIIAEDAWVAKATKAVLGLMATAYATQRMPEYQPPHSVVLATMKLAAKAAESPVLIAWRKSVPPQNAITAPVSAKEAKALSQAAELLRIVKSFPGDMDMMDWVAARMTQKGSVEVTRTLPNQRLAVMPLCHCVDQHTYRGIGHVGPSTGPTFAKRFQLVFHTTTGFNPRQASTKGLEGKAVVKETRFAQQCIARFAFQVPQTEIPILGDEQVSFRLPLDSGTLAAAAGPIPIKVKVGKSTREVLVLLGVRCPEDEIVMLKPTRATRDLFGSLNEDERANAIAQARSKQMAARSPILKSSQTIAFEDGCWRLDGKPWEEIVRAGCTATVPLVQAPGWAQDAITDMVSVLRSNRALKEALAVKAETGLVPNAESLVKKLASAAVDAVALRAVSMVRQQYVKVALPTPALDGGLGSDQLVAYRGDWDVYRLLALIARLAPGALRPTMPPNFAVVDPNLLRIVERWMIQGMRGNKEQSAASANPWAKHPLWAGMEEAESKLMEHQKCAVASMRRRDTEADTGHFLIMDTGVGKTVTSLCYLHRWLVEHGRNVTKRIIWVTPKGTVDNLVKQLRGNWSAPVWKVPRLSTAKKPKFGDGSHLVLKDYYINVIHADHLRGMIDLGLAELAPTSVIVFDEVDEMYAPTLRTSAARRLAQLTPKFVAQTATPMRKNESQLLAWLSDTCSFPVDSTNLLVAASGMVSIQLELGIASQEELHLVPMTNDVRKRLRVLLAERRWLPMAQVVQEHTDAAMVAQAVKLAVEDRKKIL